MVDDLQFSTRLDIEDAGAVGSAMFERWGDPDRTGALGPHAFGMAVTETTTLGALTIPASGAVGWHHGTARWSDGEFFRYRLAEVEPVVNPRRPTSMRTLVRGR